MFHRRPHAASRPEAVKNRVARRDRVSGSVAQNNDRETLQEGTQAGGSAAPVSWISARQYRNRRDAVYAHPAEASETTYTIGDLAEEFGITTRTIRFYETRGLLTPDRVGTKRSYTRRDRGRLIIILRGKNLGFTLEDIAEYMRLYDADPSQKAQTKLLLDKVEASIDDLQSKRADLDSSLRELKDIRGKCLAYLKLGTKPLD